MHQLHLQVPFYWSAQISGAVIASFILRQLLHPITDLGTTTPSGTVWQALVMEIIVTFDMIFVTFAVATDTKAVKSFKAFLLLLVMYLSTNLLSG